MGDLADTIGDLADYVQVLQTLLQPVAVGAAAYGGICLRHSFLVLLRLRPCHGLL